MERAFGTQFRHVEAHVGERASLAAFGARGAAWPETVLFASHNPDRVTVAHELVHIEQLRRSHNTAPNMYSRRGDPAEQEAQRTAARALGGGSGTAQATARPTGLVAFDRDATTSSLTDMDVAALQGQARYRNTDVLIPQLEGELAWVRKEALQKGILSKATYDASSALLQALTQLQPAAAIGASVDVGVQVQAALAAQQLLFALQHEAGGDKNFHVVSPMGPGAAGVTEVNPYTQEARVTTSFLFWTRITEAGGVRHLPRLIHQGKWPEAFTVYRRLMDGLDRWVADQLRKAGNGTADQLRADAHEGNAQLRTALEKIADKHATRLPAVFHPETETVQKEGAADTIALQVYFWKDAGGKYHLYDLTSLALPHEQTVDDLTAASLNTFFEEVARYPEGHVSYAVPGGAAGVAPTTGKTKWYEWVAKAGLIIAATGLALTGAGLVFISAGVSVAATICFAGGALAVSASAGGHLLETLSLGTATTTTIIVDAAQIASSFTNLGAMSLTVKAGGAAAALAGSRYFVPLLGASAVSDSVQMVALTDAALMQMTAIQRGPGTLTDKERAIAVLAAQLLVTGGLTALSVRGARNAHALRGTLEIVEQNGAKVLRPVGNSTPDPLPAKPTTLESSSRTSTTQDVFPTMPTTQVAGRSNEPELSPRVREMEEEMEREFQRKVERKEASKGDLTRKAEKEEQTPEERAQEREAERLARSQRLYEELTGSDFLNSAARTSSPKPAETETGYYGAYLDGPDKTAGLEAMLSHDGMLDFYIKKGPGTPSGGEMFNEGLNAFRSEDVRGIRGTWFGGGDMADNWKTYRDGIKAGLSKEDAAANTFTGKMAIRAGFARIEVVQDSFLRVVVEFTRLN